MATSSSDLGHEQKVARWRRVGELGTEVGLREAGCSEECIAATIGYLSSAEAHDYLGSAEAFELPPKLDEVLSMLSTTEDGQAVLLATLGRGITSDLKKLSLPTTVRMPSNENEATALCVNMSSNTNIKELHLRSKKVFGTLQGCTLLATALKNNSAIHHLSLQSCGIESGEALRCLLDGIRENNTTRTLDLSYKCLLNEGIASVAEFLTKNIAPTSMKLYSNKRSDLGHASSWVLVREKCKKIFGALKENETLEELDLSYCWESFTEEAVYEGLMDLLQFSATGLRKIKFEGSSLQSKQGRVDEELRVNRQYRSQLTGQDQAPTTSGRLVLCGYELAGKTAIRNTMQRIEHGTPCTHPFCMFGKRTMTVFPSLRRFLFGVDAHRECTTRTRGFDILDLHKQPYLAAVWDFAGQREYYALHDYLFPNVINSCFLYICNSRCASDAKNPKGTVKDQNSMRDECERWMRFLASNSKPRQIGDDHGPQLPQVRLNSSMQCAKDTVRELSHKFRDVIDLSKTIEVVNGHSSNGVGRLMRLTNDCLKDLLKHQTEYAVCKDVRKAMEIWSAKNPSNPFMTLREFRRLCDAQVRPLAPKKYRQAQLHTSEGREAVLSYLNDTGDLIFLKGLDFIVTDPRWFGVGVLGSLIDAFGGVEDPHQRKSILHTGILGRLRVRPSFWRPNHQEGFVERENIKSLLELSLHTDNLRRSIPSDKLIQLMIHLELCFETEPGNKNSSLFIPALFDDKIESAGKGKRKLEWKLERTEPVFHYLGRRLECENKSVTFLTPGFFPRLQVHLRNYIHERNWTGNRGFEFRNNLISFAENGIEVCVEYSGDFDYFVDILVRSSKPYAVALQFIEEHVVNTIVQFCASPQGCQGVLLVEAVIRPACVQGLHLCVARKPHSVLVSNLKAHLAKDEGYEHTWSQGIEDVKDTDFARDLLEGEGSHSAVPAASQLNLSRKSLSIESSGSSRNGEYLSSVQQQLPRLFYPSIEDVSWLRKLDQYLNISKVMHIKLHLMCHHKNGSHKVEGQPGRTMKLTWKANSYDLLLAKFALTLLWAGLGVGANIGLNAAKPSGSVNLPSIDNWIQTLFDVREIPGINAETLNQLMNGSETRKPVSEREILKALDRYLRIDPYTEGIKNILNLQDGTKFRQDFKLWKVVYTAASHQNTIGWVCDRHYELGLQQKILQSVPLT